MQRIRLIGALIALASVAPSSGAAAKALDAGALSEKAAAADPGAFAGVWMEPDGTVAVATTRPSPAIAALLARAPGAAPRDAVFSLGALTGVAELVADDRLALEAAGVRLAATYPDVRRNRVAVEVEGDPEAARRILRARYGPAVEIRRGVRPTLVNHVPCAAQRTSCPPLMRGGVEVSTFSTVCTSGVEARHNATREIGVITAGHCFPNGSLVMHSFVPMGSASGNAFTNNSNADAVFVSQEDFGAFLPTNWVYYDNGERERPITSVKPAAQEVVGEQVCRSGITTVNQCGPLLAIGVNLVISGGPTLRNQRKAGVCSLRGDSGGPFLSGSAFRGVTSAAYFDTINNECLPGSYTTYSAGELAATAVGATVLTSSPLL